VRSPPTPGRSGTATSRTCCTAARSEAGPDPTPNPPPWLPHAVRTVSDFLHERITVAVDHAVAGHRARAAQAEADRDRLRRDLDLLRDNVRNFLADTVACQDPPDRADANQALRGWGIDTLPARYTVTLTVTLDATVIGDDEQDAEGQAQQIVQELVRARHDDTVELDAIRTAGVREHDEPVDLPARPSPANEMS